MSGSGDQTLHSLPRADSYGSTNASNLPPVEEFKLSARDVELLRECQQESIRQRAAPFAALAGGLTHFAVHYGKIPPHPRFGAWPKVAAAALSGFILGKMSYISVAKEKFKADPHSELGRKLREKEGGDYSEAETNPEVPSSPPTDGSTSSPASSYDDIRKRNRLGVGTGVTGRTPPLPPAQEPGQDVPQPTPSAQDFDYGKPYDSGDQPSLIRRPRRRINAYGDDLEDV